MILICFDHRYEERKTPGDQRENRKRLLFVDHNDVIVSEVYGSLLYLLEQLAINSVEGYHLFILRTLTPEVLFGEKLVESEG